jgi:NTE family protein
MPAHDNELERTQPVHVVDTGSGSDDPRTPLDGIALCLSGGGYRAMLFHVGSLWRLNELGYLTKLARISSVSGGSITAGVLGLNWGRLAFDGNGIARAFDAQLVQPIRTVASKTIDEGAILGGILLPGTISDKVVESYRKYLFGEATLQDLPDDPPRFVINATSVQTGALFRFSKPFVADYRIGTASSAFPPVLSPLKLELDPAKWQPASGQASEDLHKEPYLSEAVLTDGGVYDNLGLETAWKKYKTILVSNGGGKMQAQPDPPSDWARHGLRINDIIDNQVRSLRARQVIGAFEVKERAGAYWGIRTCITDYDVPKPLPCPEAQTLELAQTPTRLKRMDALLQERLINWGYAVCDAAMRKYVVPDVQPPTAFPYPEAKVG